LVDLECNREQYAGDDAGQANSVAVLRPSQQGAGADTAEQPERGNNMSGTQKVAGHDTYNPSVIAGSPSTWCRVCPTMPKWESATRFQYRPWTTQRCGRSIVPGEIDRHWRRLLMVASARSVLQRGKLQFGE
jgi:hypothetical protein